MREYPKKIRKELHRLAGIAYDRDMAKAPNELESHFKKWREGELSSHELNDQIHKYHDGIARELWRWYGMDPDFTVPRAIADGIIMESEVSKEVMDLFCERIKNYREE